MIDIDGYKDFDLSKYVDMYKDDINDYDQILISDENIIVIKEYNTTDELTSKWHDVVYFTGGYIQNKLKELNLDQRYIWNMYIVYLIKETVDLELKLKIEKSKFCCKKYVINYNNYNSKTKAIMSEVPLFADVQFIVNTDSLLRDDYEIKRRICANSVNIISKYFIDYNQIENGDINSIIDDMVGLYYEYS